MTNAPRPPRIIEWHRADVWPHMRRVLVAGPCVLTLGALVVATTFFSARAWALRAGATLIGLLLVAAGAATAIVGMQRLLRDERYVALRTDGLVVRDAAGEALVAWDDLERATWDGARGALVVERRGFPPLDIAGAFSGIDGPSLAERISAAKRKAGWNLLR